MRIKWYEDEPGSTSSIRIMAMVAVIVCSLAVVIGLIGMMMRIPDSGAAIAGGIGGISATLACKAWQSQTESK